MILSRAPKRVAWPIVAVGDLLRIVADFGLYEVGSGVVEICNLFADFEPARPIVALPCFLRYVSVATVA